MCQKMPSFTKTSLNYTMTPHLLDTWGNGKLLNLFLIIIGGLESPNQSKSTLLDATNAKG